MPGREMGTGQMGKHFNLPPLSHYSANEWGHFYIEGGELIGHLSADVMLWAAAHPDYAGSIYFDYGNDEPQTEVRGEFYPDAEEADEALELARVA